jgi:hypothetical protein
VLLGLATLVLLLCAGKLRFSRDWFAVGRVVGNSLEMREEIHYALTLIQWLALEGGRRNSGEELWADLVFAAQRLGYSSVRLTLADGQRVWERTSGCSPTRSVVQVLQGGRFGTLELTAPFCPAEADSVGRSKDCEQSFCPCVSDDNVFEIVSELLAEGWVKGVRNSSHPSATPLRIDTKLTGRRHRLQRKLASPAARAPSPEADGSPAASPVVTGR